MAIGEAPPAGGPPTRSDRPALAVSRWVESGGEPSATRLPSSERWARSPSCPSATTSRRFRRDSGSWSWWSRPRRSEASARDPRVFFGFLTFNFFFIPPYGTFTIGAARRGGPVRLPRTVDPHLGPPGESHRACRVAAEVREEEVRALQDLSAELVAAVPGPETYGSVLARLVRALRLPAGALFVQDPTSRELREQATGRSRAGRAGTRRGCRLREPAPERSRSPSAGGSSGCSCSVPGNARSPPRRAASCDRSAISSPSCWSVIDCCGSPRKPRCIDRRSRSGVRSWLPCRTTSAAHSPPSRPRSRTSSGRSRTRGGTDDREALESINQEADRLDTLVANLLDMSRIEAGVLKARVQAVDLAE